jgi:YD repeat-containing protein
MKGRIFIRPFVENLALNDMYIFTYDLNGNQASQENQTGRVMTNYSYDGAGRLTQEAESGGGASACAEPGQADKLNGGHLENS